MAPLYRDGPLRMVRVGIYQWHCPGCNTPHRFNVSSTDDERGFFYGWDGDWIQPTLDRPHNAPGCRSWLRAGQIIFLSGTTHHLAGQTVPAPQFPHSP